MTSATLRERIPHAADPALPSVPGMTWRPLRLDDADALTELQGRIGRADHPSWLADRDEVLLDLTDPRIDLTTDTLLGAVGERAVAYAVQVMPPGQETLVRVILDGGVDPAFRGRGIGRELLRWQRERGIRMLAASDRALPGWLMVHPYEGVEDHQRLARRQGLTPTRWFTTLQRMLADPIAEVPLPAPLTIAALDAEAFERLLPVKNEVFRDHWGSQPTDPEHWHAINELPANRTDLPFVAEDAGEVVAFVVTSTRTDEWERLGYSDAYIQLVGTVRSWRRRGVAPALLTHALRAYRDAGIERATLDVDTENPSGALGIYEGLGFSPIARQIAFVEEF